MLRDFPGPGCPLLYSLGWARLDAWSEVSLVVGASIWSELIMVWKSDFMKRALVVFAMASP